MTEDRLLNLPRLAVHAYMSCVQNMFNDALHKLPFAQQLYVLGVEQFVGHMIMLFAVSSTCSAGSCTYCEHTPSGRQRSQLVGVESLFS